MEGDVVNPRVVPRFFFNWQKSHTGLTPFKPDNLLNSMQTFKRIQA